jgi:hypothetical protein
MRAPHEKKAPYENVKMLLAFLQANQNQTFTTTELLSRTGVPRGSLNGSLQVIQKANPEQLRKLSRGMWRWHENKPARAAKPPPEAIASIREEPDPQDLKVAPGDLLEIIRLTKAGSWIVETGTGAVFILRDPKQVSDN